MSLPIVNIPPAFSKSLQPYRSCLTKPQFKHFKRLVTGLIVPKNKTLQEINDAFGQCDQSSLNRFVTDSHLDSSEIEKIRIEQVKKNLNLKKKGIMVIDESLCHKTGHCMEYAGAHRSGVTKKIAWSHMIVDSFYVDTDENQFPIKSQTYIRDKDCQKLALSFYSKREMGIHQIDFALGQNLPVGLILADAGYEGEKFTLEIIARELDFAIGVRCTTNISIDRKRRCSVDDYLSSLTDDDFEVYYDNDQTYLYHIRSASIRGIGMVKLVILYSYDDDEVSYYITNLDEDKETIINLLSFRLSIECFHRDAKQHLGLEAYQVRKGRGMQVVALAILTAYTLAILAAGSMKTPLRPLRTIDEICRYFELVAYKGISWFKRLVSEKTRFIKTLKRLVFVKSAKVYSSKLL